MREEYWHLADDSCLDIKIKLCGPLDNYPIPIPGDIVRIHRLTFDRNTKDPVILSGKNVVIWRGFKENPTPITKANNPTLTENDTKRRKELEIYHESLVSTVDLIKLVKFYTVAGQIENISEDQYTNTLLKFRDGTGSLTLRVFPKRNENEDNTHYETASRLVIGDFIIATAASLDKSKPDLLNLSANTKYGRYLCKVEPNSYLGRKLTLAIEAATVENIVPSSTSHTEQPTNQAQKRPIGPLSESPLPVRRSPRLNARVSSVHSSRLLASVLCDEDSQIPKYTQVRDIPVKKAYEFYDLAGQVRGTPNETLQFNNWVFQLFDGSKLEHGSFYDDEVREREPCCAVILVFSKQRETDTEQHIEAVKKLKPGDFVHIKNAKASWKEGKLKLEMSANLAHGKSITVIDKTSRFGEMLDDIVSNPITPEDSFHDAALDTSIESTSERNPDD